MDGIKCKNHLMHHQINDCLSIDCEYPLLKLIAPLDDDDDDDDDAEGKARKILTSDIKNLLRTLNGLIQASNMENVTAIHNGLLIAKSILSSKSCTIRKERTHLLVTNDDLITNLLQLEEAFIKCKFQNEGVIELFYQTMTKIACNKLFSSKVHSKHPLSLTNTLLLLERWQQKYKIMIAIFSYLKRLLKDPSCASILCGKFDTSLEQTNKSLIELIYDILYTHKRLSLASLYSLETLAIVCRCKEGIMSLISSAPLVITFLLKNVEESRIYLDSGDLIEKKDLTKNLRYLYNILGVFLHISYVKNGREHLIHLSVIDSILFLMNSSLLINGSSILDKPQHVDRVYLLSSLVIQRCLDPLPLPLSSHFNPNSFDLPLSTDSMNCRDLQKANDGNEASVTNDDTYAYLSTSDHTDSDDDTESLNDDDLESICEGDDIVSYEHFFPEMIEFEWSFDSHNNSTNCNEEIISEENKNKNLSRWFCCCSSGRKHDENYVLQDLSAHENTCNVNDLKNDKLEEINVKELMLSAREERRKDLFLESANFREIYSSLALKTKCIQPLLSLLEPDISGNKGFPQLEPFDSMKSNDPFKFARIKIREHVQERFNGGIGDHIVIFDIESSKNNRIDGKLHFDSRFESGNLRKVIQSTKSAQNVYTLLLNTDLNSSSHVQWFYFTVSGMKAGVDYTFNIINCEKQSSLFNEGQRPIMYSCMEAKMNGETYWKRVGHSIAYFRNHYVEESTVASILQGKSYYTLTFKLEFPYDDDVCYIAYNYPYTYTFLRSNIHFWEHCYDSSRVYFKCQTLCSSLVGNDVPLITITSCRKAQNNLQPPPKYIFLMGRVHPAESNSSWILKGCIDFLLSNKSAAERLRQRYVFKIIPMINPDGVINGCSRTGAQGDDLNRQWVRPHSLLHPTIFHAKSLLRYIHHLSNKSNPIIFVDFHGHSRRKNVFLYGCSKKLSWRKKDRNTAGDDQSFIALPLVLNSVAPAFSFENCCFTIEKNREKTARITVWRELGIKLSYTLECSQAGCDQGIYCGMHLGINQLLEMGAKFCMALDKLDFVDENGSAQQVPIVPSNLLHEVNERPDINPDEASSNYDEENEGRE